MSKFTEDTVILQVTVKHSFPIELYASREKKQKELLHFDKAE